MYLKLLPTYLLLGVVYCQQPGWNIDQNGIYYQDISQQNNPSVPPEIPAGGKCFLNEKPIHDFSHIKPNDVVLCYTKSFKQLSDQFYTIISSETIYKVVEKSNDLSTTFFQHYTTKLHDSKNELPLRQSSPLGYFPSPHLVALLSSIGHKVASQPNSFKTSGIYELIENNINEMFKNDKLHCVHDNITIESIEMATPEVLKQGIECKVKLTHAYPFGDHSKTYFMTQGKFKIISKPEKEPFRGAGAVKENPKKGKKGHKNLSTTPEPHKHSKTTMTPKAYRPKHAHKHAETTVTTPKAKHFYKTTPKRYRYKYGKYRRTTPRPPNHHKASSNGVKSRATTPPNPGMEYRVKPMRGDATFYDWQTSIKDNWHKLTNVIKEMRNKRN